MSKDNTSAVAEAPRSTTRQYFRVSIDDKSAPAELKRAPHMDAPRIFELPASADRMDAQEAFRKHYGIVRTPNPLLVEPSTEEAFMAQLEADERQRIKT